MPSAIKLWSRKSALQMFHVEQCGESFERRILFENGWFYQTEFLNEEELEPKAPPLKKRKGRGTPNFKILANLRHPPSIAHAEANALLSRKYQEDVSGSSGCEYVAGAGEEHAAGDGGARSGHGAALGPDVVCRIVITDHIIFPQ